MATSPVSKTGFSQVADSVPTARGPKFQSSPDPKAGRNPVVPGGERPGRQVPILARPEGRAQPHQGAGLVYRLTFQSSPDPKAGRNFFAAPLAELLLDQFQSSPDPKAGRNR